VHIVQAHVSQSGQFFAVASIPQTIVNTIQLLAKGNERAENVIPAILSFFFHGIGFLFQGRLLRFIFTLAVSSMIWCARFSSRHICFLSNVSQGTISTPCMSWAPPSASSREVGWT
jgi:hypothetical protein